MDNEETEKEKGKEKKAMRSKVQGMLPSLHPAIAISADEIGFFFLIN